MRGTKLTKYLLYAGLVFAVAMALFPYLWTFLAATHTNSQVFNYSYTFHIGTNMMQNYYDLIDRIPVWSNLFSSLFIAVVYTALILLIDAMAGYGFSQFQFKGRDTIFTICLAAMMIPVQVVMVPLYIQFSSMKLVDTYWSVILAGLSGAFGVFLMRQSLLSFPKELIEAARIDGSSETYIFFSIVLPTMRPALTSLGILSFVNQWGNYYVPLVMLNSSKRYTMPLAMSILAQPNFDINYGALMLGACMAVLPIMILFLIFQRNFIDGMLAGSVKG
ncbi:MAG: carbohydrate ABC transporter permease [Eubacteriales bacterium]|nr:carbohydrate ABC transporter permease [Eubacteriales bacterium]